nr:PD-(D/E)XK nuclease family protein [Candidatus Neomarinimicrobiota bacterium]
PVIHNELDMKFSIDPDGTYKIRGIVDRVDQVADGCYEIHDYKTSSRAMSQNEANKDRQLALYHIGLTKIFPDVQKVKLIWHFLRQGIRREVVKSVADLDKLIDKIKALIDTIRQKDKSGGQFPAKESILCNWCYYWEECPAKNGTNPNVD